VGPRHQGVYVLLEVAFGQLGEEIAQVSFVSQVGSSPAHPPMLKAGEYFVCICQI
jgi:hypothetical protein